MNLKYSFSAVLVSVGCLAFADPILPAENAAQNTAAIQSAIDAAAALSPAGTVTLGAGTFEINAQLLLSGGVTVVGQGWDHTILKQTANGQRVATLQGGSKLEGVTVTGGRLTANWSHGPGMVVEDGTVSWCCITNNQMGDAAWAGVAVNNAYGAGVGIQQGVIDHSIIALNTAYANGTPALGEGSMSVANSGATWFNGAADGDYRIRSTSPAAGIGTWYEGIVEDLDHAARRKKPAAGCYEAAQPATFFIVH